MLKPLGFFSELSNRPHYRESLRSAMSDEPVPDETRVIQYLNAGHVLLDVPITPVDVITGDTRIIGAGSLLTDGVWIWRLDLPYYVGRYHVRLPRGFLDRVRANNYEVPEPSEEELTRLGLEMRQFF